MSPLKFTFLLKSEPMWNGQWEIFSQCGCQRRTAESSTVLLVKLQKRKSEFGSSRMFWLTKWPTILELNGQWTHVLIPLQTIGYWNDAVLDRGYIQGITQKISIVNLTFEWHFPIIKPIFIIFIYRFVSDTKIIWLTYTFTFKTYSLLP